ncbi:MAG: HD-GYP domain-containing protein [Nitrospirota bacterium]
MPVKQPSRYQLDPATEDLLDRACQAASRSDMLLGLARVMAIKDPDLYHHGTRTARYAVLLGRAAGFSPDDLIDLWYAAVLHDLGKLAMPDEILYKRGPLTMDEYAVVQSHPRAGAELLEPFGFLQTAAIWIAHHHERWDGAGYPYGLRGPLIPLGSRVLAVADTFDALTSDRPYSPARDHESALRLLRLVAGSQLEPDLVETFVRLELQPVTSVPLTLANGLG